MSIIPRLQPKSLLFSPNLAASNTCICLFFSMRYGSAIPPTSTCKVVIKGCFSVTRQMDLLQGGCLLCLLLSEWAHRPQGCCKRTDNRPLIPPYFNMGVTLCFFQYCWWGLGRLSTNHHKDRGAGTWTLSSPETSAHLDIHNSRIHVLTFTFWQKRSNSKLVWYLVSQGQRFEITFCSSVPTYPFESSLNL